MTYKKLQEKYSEINSEIVSGSFSKAFRDLTEMINTSGLRQLSEKLSQAKQTYSYLLHYFRQGVPDAGREKVLTEIRESLHSILDMWMQEMFRKYSLSKYSSVLRSGDVQSTDISGLLSQYAKVRMKLDIAREEGVYSEKLHGEAESIISRIFAAIWSDLRLTKADTSAISDALKGRDDDEAPDMQLSCTILGALLFGCLQFYDRSKLRILIETFLNTESQALAARSIVGIILILDRYPRRVEADSTLSALLDLMGSHPEFESALRETMLNLIRTRDTERINRKLADEVIPEITRLKPDLEKQMRKIDPEAVEDMELNPEWEDMLRKSGLMKKLQELSEMQENGGDLFMLAFSKMKQFPFFNEVDHWFLPFDTERTEIRPILDMIPGPLLDMITKTSFFCNSDKYSFALGIAMMPEAQRKIVGAQMDAQLQFIENDEKSSLFKDMRPQLSREIDLYIKDLFRFYSLSSFRDEFNNPFVRPVTFIYLPVLGNQVRDLGPLQLLGEFYFKRGYWKDASAVYKELLKYLHDETEGVAGDDAPDELQLLEKYGYSLEKQRLYEEALAQYKAAALINDDDRWLLRRTAECYRRTDRKDEALDIYTRLAQMEPENVNVALQTGRLLMEKRQTAEALKQFYKVCYLTDDAPKGLRPAGWCEFMSGNFEKSLDRYMRIPESRRTMADLINIGHCQMALRNYAEAGNSYAAARKAEKEGGDFEREFAADLHYLTEAGVAASDARLMLESLLLD